jgi:hypothetical protein
MDRLTSFDTSFLANERSAPKVPLNVDIGPSRSMTAIAVTSFTVSSFCVTLAR